MMLVRSDHGTKSIAQPNLLLRFQQLWAVLFQPVGSAQLINIPVQDVELTSISGVISLFAPYIELGNADRQRSDRQDTRIMLEPLALAQLDSADVILLRLS